MQDPYSCIDVDEAGDPAAMEQALEDEEKRKIYCPEFQSPVHKGEELFGAMADPIDQMGTPTDALEAWGSQKHFTGERFL